MLSAGRHAAHSGAELRDQRHVAQEREGDVQEDREEEGRPAQSRRGGTESITTTCKRRTVVKFSEACQGAFEASQSGYDGPT